MTSSEASAHSVTLIQDGLNESSKSFPASFDFAIGYEFTAPKFIYNERDVILYALGGMFTVSYVFITPIVTVGATVSEYDTSQLKFLYEGHGEFSVIPSYAVIPAQVCMK